MGEYILLDGAAAKIGTVENLYYTTFEQLKTAIDAGRTARLDGNSRPAEYLKGAYRFRFPFPDEDGKYEIGRYEDYWRGLAMPAPAELVQGLEHGVIGWHVQAHGGGHGVNVFAPCPLDPKGDGQHSPAGPVVEVVQQKPLDGELLTVIRCPYCGTLARVGREEVEALRAEVQRVYWQEDDSLRVFFDEVLRRALAGYRAPGLVSPGADAHAQEHKGVNGHAQGMTTTGEGGQADDVAFAAGALPAF